jgi:hypothetical protein
MTGLDSPPINDQAIRPVFDHVSALTGSHGLYEHALFDRPRTSHGYTTDDNARALVVLARAATAGIEHPEVGPYLEFVLAGEVPGGWRNRMSDTGEWVELRGSDDCHGRAIWGLGEAISSGLTDERVIEPMRSAVISFESTYPRSIAYAIFGAAAALDGGLLEDLMEDFLVAASRRLPRPGSTPWPWPEARLSYDNARLPEAMIVAGSRLEDDDLLDDGLKLLSWLIGAESGADGFSFAPAAGRAYGDERPGFDQQPLEAWAMADACFAAHTTEPHIGWARCLELATEWLAGANDTGVELYDPLTGAGFDGLERHGVNQNRGAESTLAALGILIRREQLRQITGY